MAFYSGDRYDIAMTVDRWTGAYAPVYWSMLACNVLAPQLLWWRALPAQRAAAVRAQPGHQPGHVDGAGADRRLRAWHRDFMPSAWGLFVPTVWDWVFLLGSICAFAWLFLAFIRVLPVISMAEMRELAHDHSQGSVAMSTESAALGPDGRVRHRGRAARRGPRAPGRPATGASRPTRPSPSTGWPRRCGSARARGAGLPARRRAGRRAGLLHAVVRGGGRLPDQRRRPAAAQLADVRAGQLRAGGARRGAFAAVGAMLWRAGLPRLHHPVFDAPDFDLATRNRFFLCLRSDDPVFDPAAHARCCKAWRRCASAR